YGTVERARISGPPTCMPWKGEGE
ncbi:hypothetical protein OPQ81_011879, partial [Rhizoctonia solani]